MEDLKTIYSYLQGVNFISISFRFLSAIVIGGIIGADREIKRRPAGIKTHALVCLGAAIVMVTGQYISDRLGYSGDVTRMAAQVVSGIGFLGAGTIIVTTQSNVKGLTTAAGLWCSACIGLAIGIGFYSGMLLALLSIILVLKISPIIERAMDKRSKILNMYIELEDVREVSTLIEHIKQCNCKIMEFNVGKVKFSGIKGASISLSLFLENPAEYSDIIEEIGKTSSIKFMEEIG